MTNSRWGVAAGLGLGLIYAASPLLVITLIGAAVLLACAGRGMPAAERRQLLIILSLALAVRLVFIGAVLISGIPHLNDLSVGALTGDDGYYVSRAIRARDIALGVTQGKYDYFVVFDEYGRTSYLQLLTLVQTLLGPTPYGMRALNALLFIIGTWLLFRLVRPGYGFSASFVALAGVLFLPSLFVSSVSLLKESAYFLTTTILLTAVVASLRQPRMALRLAAVAAAGGCLWLLDDMRRGALALAIAGIAIGLVLHVAFATPRRALLAIILVVAVTGAAWTQPALRARALDSITTAAKTSAGHVFTSGHAYKLLDEGFYMNPGTPAAWPLTLTEPQAARFLLRAVVSFLVTPLPWEMASVSELAFLPEHAIWLLILVCAPVGIAAGWRRDRMITALLIGFVIPTAAALAITNGNVGTLLRLRGLVTPYLMWIAALGALTIGERLLARRPARLPMPAGALS